MSGNAWKISDKMCVKPQPKRRIYLEPIYEKENLPIHELQKSRSKIQKSTAVVLENKFSKNKCFLL